MVVNLLTHLDRDVYELAVVSLFDGGHPTNLRAFSSHSIPVSHLGKRRGFDPRMFAALNALIGRFRPTIVHTHRYALSYALPSLILRRPPVVVHTVHSLADKEVGTLKRAAHRIAFSQGAIPVAIAAEVAGSIERVYGIERPPLIANGIPVNSYVRDASARRTWREREGFSDDHVIYVCVARLHETKNHRFLLAAFSRFAETRFSAHLLIVGDGPLRTQLEQYAHECGIGDKVTFLGSRSDIPSILGASDVFVLASIYEGSPLSIMEAMAAGLPVITTKVGGVPELVSDGECGYLIRPGDEGAFAAAMERLASGAAIRISMGRASYRRVLHEFDVMIMARKYHQLYTFLREQQGQC
jgi:glycosyltransferase involved in cell wall biosynthesis